MCQHFKPNHAAGVRFILAGQANYVNLYVWDNISDLMECWLSTPSNRISRLIASLRPVDSLCKEPMRPVFGLQGHANFTGLYLVYVRLYQLIPLSCANPFIRGINPTLVICYMIVPTLQIFWANIPVEYYYRYIIYADRPNYMYTRVHFRILRRRMDVTFKKVLKYRGRHRLRYPI